jgi:alkyl hydroperoxide reductase subunit AhpF
MLSVPDNELIKFRNASFIDDPSSNRRPAAHFVQHRELIAGSDDDARRRVGHEGREPRRGQEWRQRNLGGAELEAKAVIIATGARQVRMGIPGEKEFTMKGLCYSALSYAPLFIDKTAVVIGDGDLALRSGAELATVARHVYMVCSGDKMLATPMGKKLSSAANVTILKGYEVLEVKGDEYARALCLKDSSGKTVEYPTDAIFVEKALTPNSDMVKDTVKLDERGRIIIDDANRTNVPGIFAAGDVTNGFAEQVLIAVGEGAKAALSAYEFLLPML